MQNYGYILELGTYTMEEKGRPPRSCLRALLTRGDSTLREVLPIVFPFLNKFSKS